MPRSRGMIAVGGRTMIRLDGAPTLHDVRTRREEVPGVAAAPAARIVRAFGAVAQAGARADSDVDVLVEMEPGRAVFDVSELILDLREARGRDTDIVQIRSSSPAAERILREAVPR